MPPTEYSRQLAVSRRQKQRQLGVLHDWRMLWSFDAIEVIPTSPSLRP